MSCSQSFFAEALPRKLPKELDDFSRKRVFRGIRRQTQRVGGSIGLIGTKYRPKLWGYKAWKPACVQEKRLPEEQRGSDSRRPSVSSLQNTRFSSCGKILRRKRFSVSLALNISARPRSLAGSRRLDLFKASNFPRAKKRSAKAFIIRACSWARTDMAPIKMLSSAQRRLWHPGSEKPRNEEEKGRSQKLKRITRIEFNKQTCFCCIGFGGGVSRDIVTGPSFWMWTCMYAPNFPSKTET